MKRSTVRWTLCLALVAFAVVGARAETLGELCTVYAEDMESGAAGWASGVRGARAVGDPPGPSSWHLDTMTCRGDVLGGTWYVSNGNDGATCVPDSSRDFSQLLSPPIALPMANTLLLDFDALSFDEAGSCLSSAQFDKHDVGVTTDGGATYTPLNDCIALADGAGTVQPQQFDLSAFAGQTVQLIWVYDTVDAKTGHTFAVDNVLVQASSCDAAFCGDGNLDAGEECDDGNDVDGDGCSAACTIEPFCGDGNVDAGEECDDGNDVDGDGCSAACTIEPFCGDGNVDEGEECDDGNDVDGDGCSASCTIEPFCGDGNVDEGEECDDGNDVDGDGCSANCTIEAFCGDGNVDEGEQCDDGNDVDGDGCSASCTIEAFCGDGNVDEGEQCDDGNDVDGDGCSADCTIEPFCGDGNVDEGEECDDGNDVDGDGCSADCTIEPFCGDGNVDEGEECDDGNDVDGDGCSATCTIEPFCGDGNVDEGEACDDGNNVDGDGCSAECTIEALCGDGNLDEGEECDDGNDVDGDGCSANCTIEAFCGDGNVDEGEECDDGNDVDGDGCSAACTIEPFCGDGNVDEGEQCDDGNDVDGDGCSAACTIEPFCGDGNVDEGEACDDGNNVDGDGCSADCAIEALCGDGNLDEGEECDDGNDVDGDGCSAACTIEAFCGDGNVDEGEECDDGNNVDGDGCSAECVIEAFCGDGNVDEGEECDDGNNVDGDGCSAECVTEAFCGDGNVDEGEECDDGNNVDGDGCSAECVTEAFCGDGNVDEGEECDDGNDVDGDGCSADCTIEAFCGDGNVDEGEECDDGNDVDGDGCSANCTIEAFCGDGNVDEGEECDDGNNVDGDGCSAECVTEAFCGDGNVDEGEECDDGNNVDGDGCSAACTIEAFCGDGDVDEGEECDDGNNVDGDGCSAECVIEAFCGDGNVDEGEECDDGNNVDGDGCSAECTIEAFCGDGNVDEGEECDDGNNVDGDGCSAECVTEAFCGDGNVDEGEECDDGNDVDGDGCSANCTIEAFCGDGNVDEGEECDDGNNVDGDGCSANCTIEAFCGDGNVDEGEECDDGNNVDGDGCSANCTIEPFCGDGNADEGEECDAGPDNSDEPDAICRSDCKLGRCGDGILDSREECDDGNNAQGDGCSSACRVEVPECGNGVIESDEQCDDGVNNSDAPDAICRSDCTLGRCGDGIQDSNEMCDDGNNADGDGCSSACSAICGDGFVAGDEQCDDGPENSDLPDAACRTDCTAGGCGDGIVDSGEECDDGNDVDDDDCTNECVSGQCALFFDDLESGGGNWTHGLLGVTRGNGSVDTWHVDDTSCRGDDLGSIMFVANGNDGPSCIPNSSIERSYLLSPAVSLPVAGALKLRFDALSYDEAGACIAGGDLDAHDVGITLDGGVTYDVLNDCTALADGTGALFGHQYDIGAYAGQTVQVIFVYDTMDEVRGHTFALDNVGIFADECPEIGPVKGAVNVDHRWLPVELEGAQERPVIIAGPPTANGSDPGVIQLRNVTSTGFEARYKEWAYLNGIHGIGESFAYLALAPGPGVLSDGALTEAGTFTLTDTGIPDAVAFDLPFPGTPALFLTVQTANGSQPVTVRASNVSATGFDAALFEEEQFMNTHGEETVGYLAIYNPGLSGTMRIEGVEVPYLLQRAAVNNQMTPLLSWNLRAEEERSLDGETRHDLEQVDALALGDCLFAQDVSTADFDTVALRRIDADPGVPMEWGMLRGATDAALTIPLSNDYVDPIVIMKPTSTSDPAPGLMRVMGRQSDRFSARFQQWEYLGDPTHGPESVFYMVVEAGTHGVDGLMIEAGSLATASTIGTGGFQTVDFGNPFATTPAVFAGVQTENGSDPVTTRMRSLSPASFEVVMQEEEAEGPHGVETIGWVAIQLGSATTPAGRTFATEDTTAETTPRSRSYPIVFNRQFPTVVGDITSYRGSDPVVLRYLDVERTRIRLFLEEEQSADLEVGHLVEDVSLFVAD